MKKLAIFILLSPLWVLGQDIHFSQFDVAPLVYNPAFIGNFDGDIRFIGNQRTQWRSVTVPYSTIGVSGEMREIKDIPRVSGAASIYQDRAGDSRLNTLQFNLAGSYEIKRSADSLHRFTAGFQTGFTHRNIDYSELRYDNQWNGVNYDPGINSGESYSRDARTNLNLNIGAGWHYFKDRRHRAEAGLALHHLQKPRQSFFDDPSIGLDRRFSMVASGVTQLNYDWDLMGSLLLSRQGKFMEFNTGMGVRYILMDKNQFFRTLFAGFYFRTKDAGYVLAGMDYDAWRFGISYDFNLSDLKPASAGRGGFELSVVYVLRKFKPVLKTRKICPDYL
ncbi:MAG: type IX secretion system membrane protein PorP/SprF [Cryomorphaceae bacterium]|nr:type IX secretion system membrane protein PorP/SprF [Cryomorphaceae bacterium]